jgi:uncharacterized membrane protein YbhN (UPF0104 family)
MVIAGAVFSSGLVRMPTGWTLSSALQGVGVLLLLASAGYLAACRYSTRREWVIRGVEINLPSLRMAILQLALGALNWSLMAAVIFTLLPSKLDYPLVLGVLLISAIAGVITHIPAGLGVLEAVFVALLQHEVSRVPGGGAAGLSGDLLPAAVVDHIGHVSGGRGQGQGVANLEKARVIRAI